VRALAIQTARQFLDRSAVAITRSAFVLLANAAKMLLEGIGDYAGQEPARGERSATRGRWIPEPTCTI
jgi:hypothetical protein